MENLPEMKKALMAYLVEKGDFDKLADFLLKNEDQEKNDKLYKLLEPMSGFADLITSHADGVFMGKVNADVAEKLMSATTELRQKVEEDKAALEAQIDQLFNETTGKVSDTLYQEFEAKSAQLKDSLSNYVAEFVANYVEEVFPTILEEARLNDEEKEELANATALSLESQIPQLIASYIEDTKVSVDQIEGFKAAVQRLIPQVDFSQAVIDWRQIKNVPPLGGGGAGARTLYWLNDVDLTTAPTNGQVLAYNSTTQKWNPASVAGTGDMTKAVYDTDDDGVVDEAAAIEGVSAASNNTFYGKNGAGTIGFHAVSATVNNLSDVGDVTITTIASGEILKWNGSAWVNNTLAEAGISAPGDNVSDFTNDAGYITSYTETDPVVGAINGLVKANGLGTIAQAVADTDYLTPATAASTYAAASHTHTASQVTDFSTAADARVAAAVGVSVQAYDADLATIAAANNGSVLAATTASFTTADETKLDGIETGATADQTLDEAYDTGGSGAGRSITADNGAVEITVSDTSNNAGLVINQNDTTNNPNALRVINTGGGYEAELRGQRDGSYGAFISLVHDSASPVAGDDIGGIDFYAKNSSGTEIITGGLSLEYNDPTDGTVDTRFKINTYLAGSSNVRLLVGDSINGISVGASTASGVVQSNGNQDLILQTGNATTGTVTITDGANGDITIAPNGTGAVNVSDKNVEGVGAVQFTQQLDNGSKTTSFSVDFATDQHQKVTLTANTMTLTLDTTNIGVGVYTLEIVNGGLATLTWASETGSIAWAGGAAPTLTSSGTDIVSLLWTGSAWRGQASLAFA